MDDAGRTVNGCKVSKGKGRTRINLCAHSLGDSMVILVFNENAHIGAVAVGEYDYKSKRTSTSVITRPGHKDDTIAQEAAYLISKHTQGPSCVIVGIHLDNITDGEINSLLRNAELLVNDFLKCWSKSY